ncbi:MAG: carboxypeptidase-like regulatory domain-containing protein, partial [Planctomycetota bacterium]
KLVATVRSPLHADARFVDLEIGRDEVLDRDMILAAGVILDGFVLGKDTTLAGARVRVFNDIRDEADAISAERGMVKIKGLASGMARVHVVHPGYQETMWDLIIPADVIGFRRPFSLLQSQPFRLNVTDPQGNALPEARVRIRRQGITIVDTTASDQQWLSVLAAGKTYQVEARHAMIVNGVAAQYPPRIFRYTMPAEGPGELTIELRPGGRITGVVQAPNGAPVPGATILVRARDVHPDEASPPRLLQTNRAGVFRSEPFATGRWGLTISHTQLGTMTTEALVEENKTSSLGELRFPPR